MSSLPQIATMTPPPKPGTFYLQFQRELAATEHITGYLAQALAHVHWLYEGWTLPAGPLTGELKRIYTRAACFAVRACSDVEQKVAEGRAIRWTKQNYLKLRLDTLKAQSDEEVDQLLAAFAKNIINEHRFHLMHGATALSPADELALAEMDEEASDDPRRI